MNRFPSWLAPWVLVAALGSLRADTGVLEATNLSGWKGPGDPLVLRQHRADVDLDGLLVTVRLTQVHENRTDQDLEARFTLRLPPGASLADFALWEDGVRVPGVVLERRRAEAIYESLTSQKIDPGLVETQSPGGEDLARFTVKVYPVPARGTKRIELEYRQELELVGRRGRFSLPLAPTQHVRQRAGSLQLALRMRPEYPLEDWSLEGAAYGAARPEGAGLALDFAGSDVDLREDLALRFRVADGGAPLRTATHRDPRETHLFEPLGSAAAGTAGAVRDPEGTLLVRYLVPAGEGEASARPRRFRFLVDLSLSMRWEKLEKLMLALRSFLGRLEAADRFDLALFREGAPMLVVEDRPGGTASVEAALKVLGDQQLEGGTDMQAAAHEAGQWLRATAAPAALVLLTDGHPTAGETAEDVVVAALGEPGPRSRLAILGVGRGARDGLLRRLAEAGGGFYQKLDEVGDASFVLESFWDRVFSTPVRDLRLELPGGGVVGELYPARVASAFEGSTVRFLARYPRAVQGVTGTLRYRRGGRDQSVPVRLDLPDHDLEHPQLPRLWARARVDHLLEAIDREGEKPAWVDEIVRLAKRYKLATPYTSFLAAPRALLRPRSIRPGDPVLRVETRAGVMAVRALLPWGELLELTRLEDEGVFEGRFLAPPWVAEGRHRVRLLLADALGETRVLDETLILDSTPPSVRLAAPLPRVRAGDRLSLAVYADQDTRRLTARLAGGAPVELRYTADGHVSRGSVPVPDLPPGRHRLVVEAEDFAHNRSAQVLELEVEG